MMNTDGLPEGLGEISLGFHRRQAAGPEALAQALGHMGYLALPILAGQLNMQRRKITRAAREKSSGKVTFWQSSICSPALNLERYPCCSFTLTSPTPFPSP